MTGPQLEAGEIDRHLRRMRIATVGSLCTVPLVVVIALTVPPRQGPVSPVAVSLVAAATALWLGFTATRDAESRLQRIRRAFAVHGEPHRLLRDLRLVNLAVLARLGVMVVAAVAAAIWGSAPLVAWGILALAAAMMALTWPTAGKTHALLEHARGLRGRPEGDSNSAVRG